MPDFIDIVTVSDARAWLSAQKTVSREQMHMLLVQFRAEAPALRRLCQERGIQFTGQPAM